MSPTLGESFRQTRQQIRSAAERRVEGYLGDARALVDQHVAEARQLVDQTAAQLRAEAEAEVQRQYEELVDEETRAEIAKYRNLYRKTVNDIKDIWADRAGVDFDSDLILDFDWEKRPPPKFPAVALIFAGLLDIATLAVDWTLISMLVSTPMQWFYMVYLYFWYSSNLTGGFLGRNIKSNLTKKYLAPAAQKYLAPYLTKFIVRLGIGALIEVTPYINILIPTNIILVIWGHMDHTKVGRIIDYTIVVVRRSGLLEMRSGHVDGDSEGLDLPPASGSGAGSSAA